METITKTENVLYIDEYPELKKRVWLRRLAAERVGKIVELPRLVQFPEQPDGAA